MRRWPVFSLDYLSGSGLPGMDGHPLVLMPDLDGLGEAQNLYLHALQGVRDAVTGFVPRDVHHSCRRHRLQVHRLECERHFGQWL